jgi:hypothetical protein
MLGKTWIHNQALSLYKTTGYHAKEHHRLTEKVIAKAKSPEQETGE